MKQKKEDPQLNYGLFRALDTKENPSLARLHQLVPALSNLSRFGVSHVN